MPKKNLRLLINFFVFAFFAALCIGAQTILWPALNLPQPQLWILPFVFVILYRSFWYSLIFTYITTFILAGFSAIPIGLLLAVLIMLFVFVQFIKQRFFWPEFSFFFLVSLSTALLFPALHFALSFSNDGAPIVIPEVSKWLIQPLMMAIMSYPIYFLAQKLDRWSKTSEFQGLGD